MPELVIRPVGAPDHVALVEQAQLLNLYEEPFAHDRRLDRAGGEAAIARLLERVASSNGAALVAEVEGAVVGHMFLTIEQHGPFVREALRPYGYVADLFVRAAHRGKGIGTALLAEAERLAIARGLPRIVIGVLAGNSGAERNYRRFGFQSYALELSKDLPGREPRA